jgi:DNA invertase Pin-like site-specific DNA recombinase
MTMLRKAVLGGASASVVIYARVSGKDQEKEGFSIPAQLELLRAYASANGYTVAQEFVDVETAKQAGRGSFGRMVAFLKLDATCRTILVEKTDRLYRNFKDYVTIDELGVDIHLVKENVVLSPHSRSSEKFMHGVKVLMAKNYIDNLSEEVKKGLHQKAQEGMWPTFAPLGYKNVVGPDAKRIIVPDDELAPVVRKLFERYASGKYSLKEVAKLARADGLVYRKSGTLVPTSTVHKILRKRAYCGEYDYNGVTYAGKYEGIISKELWQEAQDVLDSRHLKRPKKRTHDFAFSNLITCGHCGCAMVGEIKKGRYIYYHCTGYKGKCPEPYTREEVLERAFTDLLRGLSFSKEVLRWVTRALRESHKDERSFREETIAKLQREHRRMQDRIDAMYMDKLDGRIDNEFFDRKATEFRSEQSRLMRDIQAHQSANRCYVEEGIRLLELAHRAHELFESQPTNEKRKLLDFVLSNSHWKDGRLEAEYRQPFDLIASAAFADRQAYTGSGPGGGSFDNWR